MSKKKSKLNKLNKFITENGEILITYLRGSMICNYVRSFFVVDCNTGYLYFFKKITQSKPTRIMHLGGGIITEGEEHFEDPTNGEHIPSFELILNKKTYQIVPEYASDFEVLLNEFKN